jgi:DNA-binding NarL/FixJ family response regulator
VHSIAQRVGVAEGTVRSQLRSIFRKLGVRSQLQAVAAFRSVNDWLKA